MSFILRVQTLSELWRGREGWRRAAEEARTAALRDLNLSVMRDYDRELARRGVRLKPACAASGKGGE